MLSRLVRGGRGGRRQGAIVALVAIGLVALMGMVALALDVGRLTVAAQRVQNVADGAALAAANQDMSSDQTGALSRAGGIVTANHDSTPSGLTWNSGETIFYDAGQTVPDYRLLADSEQAITVTVREQLRFDFAPIVGVQGTEVYRRATALRRQTSGFLSCIFAHGISTSSDKNITYNGSSQIFHHSDIWSNCDITMNGSGQHIDAAAHANRDFTINGSNQTVTGIAEYVREWVLNGSNQHVTPVKVPSNVKPYPINYTAADYSYDYEIGGDYTINGSNMTVPPGVYRVHGKVTLNGSNINITDVTFVADDDIVCNGSNFGPAICKAPNYMLFHSLHGDITVNGARGEWRGTLFAPQGKLTFNGSNQCVKNGSLMAEEIIVNGSGWHIYGSPDPGGGEAVITLIK